MTEVPAPGADGAGDDQLAGLDEFLVAQGSAPATPPNKAGSSQTFPSIPPNNMARPKNRKSRHSSLSEFCVWLLCELFWVFAVFALIAAIGGGYIQNSEHLSAEDRLKAVTNTPLAWRYVWIFAGLAVLSRGVMLLMEIRDHLLDLKNLVAPPKAPPLPGPTPGQKR